MAQVLVECDDDEDIDVWAVPAHVRAYGRAHRQLAAWSAGVDHLLVNAAAPRPGEDVVDLGSGTGLPALTLASLVGPGRVVAVDRCPEMLDFAAQEAERLGIDNLDVRVADARELPLADESVDLVTSRFALSWFSDPLQALDEARRVLKPGGRVCIVVPGSLNQPMLNAFDGTVRRSLGLAWPDPRRPGPARYNRSGLLRDDLKATGFSAVSERSENVEGFWSGSGAQVWQFASTRLEPVLAPLPARQRVALGRTVVASLERHRRGKLLHLPIHVHMATAVKR